jgi:glutamate/tyrosine decarboxylase-like PLP-dependent enzyme
VTWSNWTHPTGHTGHSPPALQQATSSD